MKKTVIAFIAATALVSLAGCGSNAELEALRKENEALKQQTQATAAPVATQIPQATAQAQTQQQTQQQAQTQTQAQTGAEITPGMVVYKTNECEVVYRGCALTTDVNGKDAVILNYTFTNLAGKEKMFTTTVSEGLYQDNLQLETAFLMNNGYSAQPSITNVQPGGTIEVQTAKVLRNNSGVAEFEMTDVFKLSGVKTTGIIKLQ